MNIYFRKELLNFSWAWNSWHIKMSLVSWFVVKFLTHFLYECGRRESTCYWPFTIMNCVNRRSSWKSVQKLKPTTKMWVHLQVGMSARQCLQNVPSLDEEELPLTPSIGLNELQNTHCCILTTEEQENRVFQTNLTCTKIWTQYTIPYMFQHFLWVPSSGSPYIG
jgi:hypothetical protein